MMRFVLLSLALAVSACTTAPGPEGAAPQSRAQALATLLVETEAADPARLAAAGPQMAALERALTDTPAAPEPAIMAVQRGPAPDLSGARSVMSAVHIASYREHRHAVSGWTELAGRHDVLAGRQARLARADLGERGVYLRLKAGPFDTPSLAVSACEAIRASGDWCAVTDFSGEAL